ncbi:MAG: type II toxin-antitoxin system PemK/MazF family toxin [Methyloceanibacter sp.]
MRGEIYWCDFPPPQKDDDSRAALRRLVAVVSNDQLNRKVRTVIAVPMSTSVSARDSSRPTDVVIEPSDVNGLMTSSTLQAHLLTTVNKTQLARHPIGELDEEIVFELDSAIRIALDLESDFDDFDVSP